MDLPVVANVNDYLVGSKVGCSTLLSWIQFVASKHYAARQLVPAADTTRPWKSKRSRQTMRRNGLRNISCRVSSTSRHVTSCHVMSHHVMSCHVTSCHVTSCHVILIIKISGRTKPCHVMSFDEPSHHVKSQHGSIHVCGSCCKVSSS